MHITYASRDLDWTDLMQDSAARQIAEPVAQALRTGKFDLSLYCEPTRTNDNEYEMWTVLQTYDGRGNRVVRRVGNDFEALAADVGQSLKEAL